MPLLLPVKVNALLPPVKVNAMGQVGGLGMGLSLLRQVHLMIMYFSFPEFPPPREVLADQPP